MMDANVATMSGAFADAKPMADGSGAHLAEQASIEADRLSGTMRDGIAAAQAASENYGGLFLEAYVRAVQTSILSNADIGHHVLTLMQARNLTDVFKTNVDFLQRQMSSAQGRFLEMTGVREPGTGKPDPERLA